jgi:hypothetical protein
LTSTSTPPSAVAACITQRATSLASARSVGSAWAVTPRAAISARVASSASAPRAQMDTAAPCAAKPSAMDRPMPLLPPATSTRLPANVVIPPVLPICGAMQGAPGRDGKPPG